MIYHFLTEIEHFSEFKGGAISRWAANVLRDEPDTHIVCSSADDTWRFSPDRIHLAPGIRRYLGFRARRLYPPQVSGPILRHFYGRDVPPIQKGDVMWVHGVPALAEALLPVARKAGAKLVFHLHSSAFVTHSSIVIRRLQREAAKVVFCSKFLSNEAHARFPTLTSTAVLYNGADETMFFPPERRDGSGIPVVLFASRLVPQKGAHALLEAMQLLEQRGVPIKAKIFGASFFGGSAVTDYMRSLQQNVPSNVAFAGYESGHALAQHFREADIFCLPATYNDPFPLAILEAMASGLPVVASDAGGIPEIFTEGGGILVPPNDAITLADTLERLVRSPDERRSISEDGLRSFLRRFTWSSIIRSYQSILASL